MIMRPLASATRAAIAGAKGGSSQARKPVEAPDSLHSTDYARILDLISEGEIVGLVNGLQSVFLDETPVANGDGSLNFKNVQIDTRVGTQDQDYIKGFPAVESELGVNLELQFGTPWTRAINNTSLSAIRVRLSVPTLSKADTSNGDIKGHSVQYAIDLSTDGGSFVTVLNSAFTGKTSTKYVRSHRIDLPAASSGWIVRVRRLTPQANSGSVADLTFVESFAEILDGKFRYPNSALAAVVVDASQFQNIPTRAYHIRGRIVQVPSNYNPTTRAYTGIWDGTFQPAWTNNPAWVYYDLATNPRYGLGHLVQASQVDKWALYKIARYCDELVSDGAGGQEPRFTCNVYLQTRVDAFKLLQDLASIFRGISFWTGATIKAVADMPEDPVYIYTAANVIDGKFLYQGSGKKARHTVAMVSWNDPGDFGRAKVEPVIFEEGIARYGINQTDIIAFGCTSKTQAQRAGRWLLFTEHMETNTVTFSVGLEGTVAQPGQVVLVADPARAGRRIGGRVSLATNSAITVDAAPTVAPGDTISCVLPDAVAQERTVQSVVGRVITTTTPFTDIPVVGAVWTVQSETLAAQKFRVISVAENEGMTYTLTGIQHAEGKFDAVENGVYVEPAPTTILPPSVQLPPTGITITHREVAGEITAQVVVNVDWLPVPSAIAYDVEWRQGQGEWIAAGRVSGTSLDVPNVLPGTFEARITAINSLGIKSSPVKSSTYAVPDQTTAPDGVITPGRLGGAGVNLLPDPYSTFQQTTLPSLVMVNLTPSRDGSIKRYEGSLLLQRQTAGTSGNLFLCPSLGYNIPHSPGKRYIVSFYYLTNTITAASAALQDNVPVNSPASAIVLVNNGQWQRASAIVDASALVGRYLALNLSFAGPIGYDIRIDGVMVEEAVGTLNQASAYSRGQSSGVALQALAAAALAQDTADGKIDTFFQTTAPAGASLGDLWFKTDEGNKQYRYNGSSWVLAQDTAIGTAIANAAGAQATADGKVRTFFGPESGGAVATAVGDLWYVTDLATMFRWSGSSWVKVADNAATVIGTAILNPKFEAGKSGWTGFTTQFYWQGTGGVANSPRVVNIDTGGIRLYNEGRMPVRPGSILMLSAYMHRNGVAADGVAYLSAVIFDKDGAQVQVCDCAVTTAEIGTGSPQYIRKFTPVLVGTAAYAVFNLYTGITGAGGAWGFDSVNMVEIPDSKTTQAGVGKNLVANADFGGSTGLLTPWFVSINTTGNPYTLRNYRDSWTYPTYKMPSGGNVEFRQAGGASAGVLDFASGKKIEVTPNQRFEAHIRYAVYRCNWQIYIEWTDASGSVVGYSEGGAVAPNSAGSPPTLANYSHFGFFATAPATAAFGRFCIRLYSTASGQSDSVGFFTQPFFGVATQNQTEFSEWSSTAPYTADQISDGNVYGNLALDDTVVSSSVRRLGLRISTSGHRLGSQRNFLQVAATTVRSTTALSATSAGAVSVAAFSQRYGSFSVNYSAVANAVTGLTPNVTYVIYCIDDDFSGGTRTWFAGNNPDAVMQLGDGVVIAGNIKIPTSGSSTGGGGGGGTNPGDWCVDYDTVLPDGRLVRDLKPGDLVECIDVVSGAVGMHKLVAIGYGEEECYRLTTPCGSTVVQSRSTPMDLPDGSVRRTEEMFGRAVVCKGPGGISQSFVCDLQYLGVRRVVKPDFGNRMFFAGERSEACIATHNVQYKP